MTSILRNLFKSSSGPLPHLSSVSSVSSLSAFSLARYGTSLVRPSSHCNPHITLQKRDFRLLSLSQLTPAPGSRKKKKRIGRGQAAGLGGSSTRGQRGQKARGAMGKINFEGGQTPLFRRIPKRGFSNKKFKEDLQVVNIDKLVEWIEKGRIDPNKIINMKTIFDSNLIRKIKYGVKLLSTGHRNLKLPLQIEVTHASETAKAAIERAGGTIKYVYFNGRGLRAHLQPERFPFLPKSDGVPPPKHRHRYLDEFPNFDPIRAPTYHEYAAAVADREAEQAASSTTTTASTTTTTTTASAKPVKPSSPVIPKSEQKSAPKKSEKNPSSTPSN